MARTAHTTAAASAGSREATARIIGVARRAAVPMIAGAGVCALLLALAWQSGGYFPEAHLKAGAAASALLAFLLAVRAPAFAISGPTLLALASLGGLAVWTGLSARWSSMPDVALEDMQRTLVLFVLFGLGILAAGSGRHSRALAWAMLGVLLAIAVGGLLSRLFPETIGAGTPADRFAGYRLAYPLSYWNAFGATAAMALVLACGLAADPRSHWALRAAAAGGAVLAGTAGYLSFSRGGWLALIAGMVVLLLLGGARLHLLATIGIVGGALTVAILRLRAFPGLTDDPAAGAGQVAEGRSFASTVFALAAAAAVAQGLLAFARLRPYVREQLGRMALRALPVAAGVLVAVAGIGYLAASDRVERRAAGAMTSVENWVERQWDEFMTPAQFSASGAERLTTARGSRSDLYRVAIDGFEADPLRGDGSGGFEVRFTHDREVTEKVRDAHSLYLETLGELGLVGILLLGGLIGAIVWAAVVARLRPRALTRSQSAAVTAAVFVWIAHAMADWDWQMPALTGSALVLAAALFPVGLSSRRIRLRRERRFR